MKTLVSTDCETCLRRPLKGPSKMWSLWRGGLLIQGHLTGNSTSWSWIQLSCGTGVRLIRVVALASFTVFLSDVLHERTDAGGHGGAPSSGTCTFM